MWIFYNWIALFLLMENDSLNSFYSDKLLLQLTLEPTDFEGFLINIFVHDCLRVKVIKDRE